MSLATRYAVDLHTHTRASDGQFTAARLIQEAAALGVETLAITDHDTTRGFDEVRGQRTPGLRLMAGIELSCIWRRRTIHVVGLNIDTDSPPMRQVVEQQQAARIKRAEKISARLNKAGIANTLADAEMAAGGQAPGRPHFAEVLVARGVVNNRRAAFRRWLGDGKPAACSAPWITLKEAIDVIGAARGASVLAHPLGYRLTRTKLTELISDFTVAGGDAAELHSGAQGDDETAALARLIAKSDLAVSVGSDFHHPGSFRNRLGQRFSVPAGLRPVWLNMATGAKLA